MRSSSGRVSDAIGVALRRPARASATGSDARDCVVGRARQSRPRPPARRRTRPRTSRRPRPRRRPRRRARCRRSPRGAAISGLDAGASAIGASPYISEGRASKNDDVAAVGTGVGGVTSNCDARRRLDLVGRRRCRWRRTSTCRPAPRPRGSTASTAAAARSASAADRSGSPRTTARRVVEGELDGRLEGDLGVGLEGNRLGLDGDVGHAASRRGRRRLGHRARRARAAVGSATGASVRRRPQVSGSSARAPTSSSEASDSAT